MEYNFKAEAMEYVKQAEEDDNGGNYARALPLYMNSLEYFKSHLKFEKDPIVKQEINLKITQLLDRADQIRRLIDHDGGDGGGGGSGSTLVVGSVANDPEQTKQTSPPNSSSPPFTPGMYSNFKAQAIEYVKQAIEEDNGGNYARAFPLYMSALEYFKTHLKYEKNPKIKEAISHKFTEYLRRAEEIRALLDDWRPRPASSRYEDDPDQARLRAVLNSAIVREKPDVKWNDVAGLEIAKQALQEALILPLKFPHFFTGKRRPWKSFLFYGPRGTGKLHLAKATATEAHSTFFSISSSDLVSKWMSDGEKLVSNLFQMARDSAPSIIFIDEIDYLCGQRGDYNENEASRCIKRELLKQMQSVGHKDQKVLVIAATNTPYTLDQATRQQFDKRIYIRLPDVKARQHMFKVHLGRTPHNLTETDSEDLASRTDGFSGSDISVCVKNVLSEHFHKTEDATFFIKTSDDMWEPCGPEQPDAVQTTKQELAAKGLASKILHPPITRTDFNKALSEQGPTANKADLEVYERFTKEFGEEG